MKRVGGLFLFTTGLLGLWLARPHVMTISKVAIQARSLAHVRGGVTDEVDSKLSDRDSRATVVGQIEKDVSSLAAQNEDEAIERYGRTLTRENAEAVKKITLDVAKPHVTRFVALHILGQNAEFFAAELEAVAKAEARVLLLGVSPHTEGESDRHFEEALRVQALLFLDELSVKDAREKEFFSSFAREAATPLLRKLARMGAVGSSQGIALIEKYQKQSLNL